MKTLEAISKFFLNALVPKFELEMSPGYLLTPHFGVNGKVLEQKKASSEVFGLRLYDE